MSEVSNKQLANAIRALSMDAVEKAQSGHPGMPLGMADVATILFKDFLKFNAKDPDWLDRDRFILSAGHGSMLLYSLLYLTGYKDMTIEQIKNFRQFGSITAGHPEYGHAKGIETTTGPLGQGIANSVGFALAERMLNDKFGDDIIDHYTYVIAGDGCLMEGISHEAISLAGHLKLNKLIVLFDDNGISIDGPTSLSVSDDQNKRFAACGWNVCSIDGHDPEQIRNALENAKKSSKPSLISCKTTIAYGAPTKAGTCGSHGAPLGEKEIDGTRKNLNWSYPAFEIPSDILDSWRQISINNEAEYNNWCNRVSELDGDKKSSFTKVVKNDYLTGLNEEVNKLKKQYTEDKPKWATRKSSGEVLAGLTMVVDELIGGSADLTGSNLTKTASLNPVTPDDYSGRYIYYGVREHAMAACMNGIALHGGFIPYGGTFLVFTDYCKPAIRLSALMQQRVIYVMTHDSIGLGEDGPTHQPIEHLAALRAVPNLYVFRPADAVEVAESWQASLQMQNSPSILALTRQGVPLVRENYVEENLCSKGAYILSEAQANDVRVTIYASGSEVEIALNAKRVLESENIGTRVVSAPCLDLFYEQDIEYQTSILCNDSIKVAVEAASKLGWERIIGPHGIFIGMESFGASAPIGDLYKHFQITAENIVNSVKAKIEKKVIYDGTYSN